MNSPNKSYGVVVVHQQKGTRRYLILLQTKGHLSFPKGHAEGNEGALEAARRELREETGIINCEILPEPTFEEEYDVTNEGEMYRKENLYFIGLVKDQHVEIQKEEVKEYYWVSFERALEMFVYENPKRILRNVEAYLQSYGK